MTPRAAPTTTTVYAEQSPAAPSLLDAALAVTGELAAERPAPAEIGRLDAFLCEKDTVTAVKLWLGTIPARGQGELKQKLVRRLNSDVARIDELLNAQVNAVLHHPAFQKLE